MMHEQDIYIYMSFHELSQHLNLCINISISLEDVQMCSNALLF